MRTISSIGYNIRGFARRSLLLLLNGLINNKAFFYGLGFLNRRAGFLKTVFVCYAASEEYTKAYVFARLINKIKWRPWPVGFFVQNGKLGLVTVVSSVENEYRDPKNLENLQLLRARTEALRQTVGAEQVSFSGILPGIFHKNKITDSTTEADVTVAALLRVVSKVKRRFTLSCDVPIILLGAKGYIGSKIALKLEDEEVYPIDIHNQHAFPSHLSGRPSMLLNMTTQGALERYVDRFWPELIVVNEVYPPPSGKVLERLKGIGCAVLHVVGVESFAFPPFPNAYKGGIPCCAAWASPEMRVILREW